MIFKPFRQQREVLTSSARIKVLIAAKRSGKSEACYIDTIMKAERQPGYVNNGRDPYMIALIAPTDRMLRTLVWPKFRAFAMPFEHTFKRTESRFSWRGNNTVILGISAEKIQRIEGLKLHHVHMTEAFQMSEHVFTEVLARISDSRGSLTIDGSLGTNIVNPKRTWIYRTFKEAQFDDTAVWEWATTENPHFPQDELARLKNSLNPRTYRQLFEIDWNAGGTALVYDDWSEANETEDYKYNPDLDTYCSIDWGWAHEMACVFFQYDKRRDVVYCFDEIVQSKMTLAALWAKIKAKGYRITDYFCDIAGTQEREQTGRSNVKWFRDECGISMKYRSTAIQYGIPIVRNYIKNGLGQRKIILDTRKCPKTLDGIKNYSYPEKDGIILNENPVKKDDDAVDAFRYFFVNKLDPNKAKNTFTEFNRWSV